MRFAYCALRSTLFAMTARTIATLLRAHTVDMDGMPVRQAFPTLRVGQLDPFLLLHHAELVVPEDHNPDHEGVGPHPHRGFSPVTFVFAGGVHHRDSRGNDSTVYAGGAQWMRAGMGIVHSERPSRNIHALGGRQEIIQVWINTPAGHKMDQPAYFALQAEDVPSVALDEGRATARVFSGD